ncbi:hypothetical protein [Aurantiacibacter zhengii]|uniref:Uncharacterized protein n=1 Tax=Aurantiacibacter zhengii TaxID=2307003 RepID=A0A418NMT6_9SPHN|nr:hypothetical protein [Aurantiacibacter zhengii]RIV82681.1 hypothetical protein D2V07_17705 [Aurantiacibacter zhengii]
MMNVADAETRQTARPGLWAGLFAVNMALIAVLSITDALEQPVPVILIALNCVLLIPMVKAALRRMEDKGAVTTAVRRYNRRFLGASLLYAVSMIGAGTATNYIAANSPLMWALAVLPMLPAFGMIWAMMRYLAEETDEYQRHRAVQASMVGLALVLVLGTGWGFLETFGLVPHIWAWWVFPAWAMGLGIGMAISEWRHGGSA